MNTFRNLVAGAVLAGGVLLTASLSIASTADDASAVTSPPPAAHGSWAHARGPGRFFSQLGLTAEQKTSIKSIMMTAMPQMKSLHEQMRANQSKIMQTNPSDPNYANLVAEMKQSNATLASQRTAQAAEIRTRMYAVLTPEQQTQLAALEAQSAAEPHHGRGRGAGAAPQPPAE